MYVFDIGSTAFFTYADVAFIIFCVLSGLNFKSTIASLSFNVISCLPFAIQLIFKLGRFNSDVSCEIKVKPLLHISSSFLFVASRFNQPIVFAMKQYASVTKVLTLSYCHIQIMSRIMIMDQKGVKPNFCTNCSISFMFISKFSQADRIIATKI